MPYTLEHKKGKGYKIHLQDDPQHVFSKKYQSKKRAIAQMQAIEISKRKRAVSGGGIDDILRKVKNTVNSIISIPTTTANKLIPEKTQYTRQAELMLQRYGNFQIENMTIEKEPVNNKVMMLADSLSAFELKAIMQKAGIDKFYHISMVVQILTAKGINIKLRIEKNENITIEPYTKRPNTQSIPIDLKEQKITIRDLLEKTRIAIGNDHFFKYRWDSWNCADFIIQLLQANGLLVPADYNFIWQNSDIIKKNMTSSSSNRLHLLTKLGSYISHLKGGEIRFI
jgi:hypothetical protein